MAVVLLAWIALQLQARSRETASALNRLDARLDEQGKRGDGLAEHFGKARDQQQEAVHQLQQNVVESFGKMRDGFEKRQTESQVALQDALQSGVDRVRRQLTENLTANTDDLVKRMVSLTKSTDERLQQISGQVDKRLTEGLEKTHATFTDIRQRLALIDDAQKKITELSTNVVSLQRVLADRTSRGAFGEVQLHALVSNALPESVYSMQYSLQSGKRADCVVFLPEPTGMIVIDSKFPLDNYQRKMDPDTTDDLRKSATRDFQRDVLMHIDDIASKYIVTGETASSAILFLPAEAVFAEIHAHHRDIVEYAHRKCVLLTSPTTLMAILTTSAAVIKDSQTREQVHKIQEHLRHLSGDFERFQSRMDKLALHIDQANRDVGLVNTSARKISGQFQRIEQLELTDEDKPQQMLPIEETDIGDAL
jgi:DNA recombination protein RmuC